MAVPVSKHRLRSSAFDRPDERIKVDPKRMVFLSVEGDETERTYFQNLSNHLDNSLVKIEVLRHRRGDGYSDPEHVLDLLTEYINVREGELIPKDLPESFSAKYSKEIIQAYLDGDDKLSAIQRKEIEEELLLIGIDLDYRRYLQNCSHDNDVFAVVLDRDCGSHSRQLMEDCVQKCESKGYGCYITNPCFEFWLLLHLCDVKNEYSDEDLGEFLMNAKVSNNHTRTSYEVSRLAGHKKHICTSKFEEYYLPNIQRALINAKQFANSFPDLYDQLGTNLPQLMCTLGFTTG